jgi:hypothetical protein
LIRADYMINDEGKIRQVLSLWVGD